MGSPSIIKIIIIKNIPQIIPCLGSIKFDNNSAYTLADHYLL